MQRLSQYLVVNSSQPENRYGPFAEQILLSEGLMGFTRVDLAEERLPELQPGDLVLVTRCFLRRTQLDTLLAAVNGGVSAVFLQPQQLLAELLGFAPACRVTYPGYVRVRMGQSPAELPLQTHLPIPCYDMPETVDTWDQVAGAFDAKWHDTGYAAVLRGRHGQGALALFFYDVAEAVARIRFGNPDLGGYIATGRWAWPHAFDLFSDHVDQRVAHLPQADLHAQLLAWVLTDAASYPLPRLWYYEEAAYRTAGILESDGDMSEPEQFHALAAAVEQRNGTGTFYLMKDTKLSESDIESMRARGHTFAPHVHPRGRTEETYFAMPDGLKEETDLFTKKHGAVSPSLQCHLAPWPGYMSMVPAHVANGYRLLFAYLPSPFGLWGKHMCGSGRPMKFYDRDGTLHDCWQQPVVTMDDTTLVELLRDRVEEAQGLFDTALDAAVETNHTALAILSHPVSFCTYSGPVVEYCFDRLHDAGARIYNADEWLKFADNRSAIRVELAKNEEGDLVCDVSGLECRVPLMVPMEHSLSGDAWVTVNERPATGRVESRFGEQWCFIQLDPEEHGPDARIVIGYSGQPNCEGGR
jgi:hypothetical protein